MVVEKPYTNKDKWIVAIVGGLLFLILSSPYLYSFTNKLTSNIGGVCPTVLSLIVHAFIFVGIVKLLLR
jgi:hypothetical protein